VKNISDILWDSQCTGADEYLLRRWFYGRLNKLSETPCNNVDYAEDVLIKSESLQDGLPDYSWSVRGVIPRPEKFGWEEGYSREMRQYLKYGVESFKIYDNQG
jgi:hypothetical protein